MCQIQNILTSRKVLLNHNCEISLLLKYLCIQFISYLYVCANVSK